MHQTALDTGRLFFETYWRSGFHNNGYPYDHWRFYPDAGRALAQWATNVRRHGSDELERFVALPEDLRKLKQAQARDRLDSLLSAVRTKRFFWQDNATPINDDPPQRPCRQNIAGTLMENRHADYRLDSLAVA
jgi:hypothetical protein